MNRKFLFRAICVGILFLLLLSVSLAALCIGASKIAVREIFGLISSPDKTAANYSIIFQIRLPRIILGFAIGSALSIAGVILQGMFRNPLVEPYTLGISGGAALGVCFNLAFHLNRKIGMFSVPLAGFLGAIAVVIVLYALSAKKGILKIQGLLLCGVMISFISSSLVMLIMALMRIEDLKGIVFWMMGSLEQPDLFLIKIMVGVSLFGAILTYGFSKELNAFSLGEEQAMHLGINTEAVKKILFFLASLLTGAGVAVSGIIGFVGLVIPHFVRMFVGNDHRILIICAYLLGGTFLILCDTLARTIIMPLELPVGVITGIVGGIIFIYALTRKKGW